MKKLGWLAIVFIALLCSSLQPAIAAKDASYSAKVVADSLNVRSEPSIEAAVQGSLQNGEFVAVSKEEHGWLLVKSKHFSGWVAGYYLKKADGPAPKSPAKETVVKKSAKATKLSASKQATVLADSLRVRSGPGTKYSVQGGVQEGDKLDILDSKGNWLQIRTAGGTEGWVSGDYVGSMKASSSEPARKGGLRGKLIVVDPGHGGSDPGMIGAKFETLEKDLTLSTSHYLVQILRDRGAQVILTRTKDDEKPSLSKRVEISESNKADAFVSIHYNSAPNKATGTLTFYNKEDADIPLAKAIEARLSVGIGLRSNGYAFGDYHVLRENDRPSALVELGFLSNAKDEALVRTSDYQRKASNAIADGLEDYFTN